MSNTLVQLTHTDINSGNPVQILCTAVRVGFNKKNDKTPNANYDQYPSDVQSVGRENVKYTLQSAKIDKGDLTYSLFLDFINLEHDDSDPILLNVKYNSKYLTDSLGATTDIPVTIDGTANMTFSTIDSRDAAVPEVNIPLVEVYNV